MGISMGWPHYIEQHEAVDSLVEQILDDDSDASDPAPTEPVRLTVPAEHGGWRLDRALAASLPSVSRSRIQVWISQGGARINSKGARASDRVAPGDQVEIDVREPAEAVAFKPEPMQLAIVHEDELLIVIDKPPGLVVHPGAGNWSGTLLTHGFALPSD